MILELNRIRAVLGHRLARHQPPRPGRTPLRHLDSPAGRQVLAEQGVTARTVRAWMRGKATPSAGSRERIDAASWWRRENPIRSGRLVRHLDNDGRGRRLEFYSIDQSHVDTEYARPLNGRSITVRYISPDLVQAWAVLLFALRAPRRPSRRGSASSRIR